MLHPGVDDYAIDYRDDPLYENGRAKRHSPMIYLNAVEGGMSGTYRLHTAGQSN